MDRKHLHILNDMKNDHKVVEQELDKYRHHPIIKDLSLSDQEFKQYLGVIVHMIKEREDVFNNQQEPYFYYTQLIRNTKGKLEVISVPNDKTYALLQIKNHYWIRHFPNSKLKILLNIESIGKKVDESKKAVLRYYHQVLEQPKQAHGVFVYGSVGIGKTYTAIALANEFAMREKSVAFVNCAEIAYKLKQGFDQPNSVNDEIVNKMKNVDVLFLDDLGAEDEKIWFYNNYLLIILNHRMDHNKLTFFTSNLSIDSFYKKLSNLMHKSFNAERLVERIRALTQNKQMQIIGNNFRY
ncbi:MAG: ATP-binding protein [Mycoplasmataceae bacterium]|nr:ATP-binding protein [Mycoplasmataceae bacterium]